MIVSIRQVLALSILSWAAAHAAGQVVLDDPHLDDFGADVEGFELAEVDGDGLVDLVLHLDGVGLGVRHGLGDGGFGPFTALPGTAPTWRQFTTGDADGDGRDDLFVSPFGGLAVRVFLSAGGGGFTEAAPLVLAQSLASQGRALLARDMDGDEVLDLVAFAQVNVFAPGEVLLFSGQGGGLFAGATLLGAAGTDYDVRANLLPGDLNGDSVVDLVTPTAVFLGTGGGGFEAPTPLPPEVAVHDALAVGDVNGDGADDILARTFDLPLQDNVRLVMAPGAGRGAPGPATVLGLDPGHALAVEDLDGDGRTDVLFASAGGFELTALLQQPDGSLAAAPLIPLPGGDAADLQIADIDHDGDLDLVLAGGPDVLTLMRGDGTGRFGPSYRWDQSDGENWDSPSLLTMGDLDGDGDPELMVVVGDSTVWVQAGSEGLGFGAPVAHEVGDMGEALFTGQVAGDASGDLVGVDRTLGFRAFPGLGDLGFGPVVVTDPSWNIERPLFADLDGDGLQDFVVRGPDPDGTALNDFAQVWLAQGDGSFVLDVANRLGGPTDTGEDYQGWELGHFDDDGLHDLLVVAQDPARVELHRGLPQGGFRSPAVTTALLPEDAVTLRVGDVDHDGRDDAVLLLEGTGAGPRLSVLPGLGDWLLGPAVDSAVLAHPEGMQRFDLVDLDRDGLQDAVFSGPTFIPLQGQEGLVLVALGQGDGTFVASQEVWLPEWTSGQVVTDVDGDGAPEVVVETRFNEQVTVLGNRAGPWTYLGDGLAGATGVPSLRGYGTLVGGDTMTLSLGNALPFGPASFVMGFSILGAPFKGGVWVPTPTILIAGLPIDGDGRLAFSFTLPTGLPTDVPAWFQYWIPDAEGVVGFAASNALRAITRGDG